MPLHSSKTAAPKLDADDPLGQFRNAFHLLPDRIYMDGNSLGLLSRPAEAAVLRVLDEWKTLAIDGWMGGEPAWFTMAEELAARVASLVGAEPDEVIVANQTTVNLHQLLATLYKPTTGCFRILADALSFPSDIHAIVSHLRLRGLDPETHLIRVPSCDGFTLDEEDIIAAMTPDVAMAVLPSVVYTSGQLLDMERLAKAARERGILVGFDCSHSVGVLPHALSDWDVDFAFWCHYKYLNNGPGGTGGLYLNRRHHDNPPGLAGWFSADKSTQFDMSHELAPATSAGAMQIGTPSILGMAALGGSLDTVEEAGIDRIRAKSLRLTAYLRSLVETELAGHGFHIVTPAEDARRGGHLALAHPEASRICRALKSEGVVPDFRPPNLVRLGPAPLYTTFEDCWGAVQTLRHIMERRSYELFDTRRDLVA